MGAGKRRQIRKQICNMLYDFTKMDLPMYPEGWQDIAAQIMKLFPKPEACVMYRITTVNGVEYFKCSKCDGVQFDAPHRFCPHCARRVIATEDMSLWL